MSNTDSKIRRVCVLRGGPSSEYELSLDSGAHVLMNLENTYHIHDILIDRKGKWFRNGKIVRPEEIFWDIDIAVNALHGEYGEDGQIQKILEAHSIPYTGSGSFASALALNKYTAKKFFKAYSIKTPFSKLIRKDNSLKNIAMNIFNSISLPLIIKPVALGSSQGVVIAHSFEDLMSALKYAFSYSDELVVEEYIEGQVVSCGVVENFRGEGLYALVPVLMKLPENEVFLDYEKRHQIDYEVPANLSSEEKDKIQEAALLAHSVLGLRHYSQSDFIISKNRGVFLLETNSLPHIGQKAPFIEALDAVGSSTSEFLHHIIRLALK